MEKESNEVLNLRKYNMEGCNDDIFYWKFFFCLAQKFNGNVAIVYCRIYNMCLSTDPRGFNEYYASMETLANDCGISIPTARKCVKILQKELLLFDVTPKNWKSKTSARKFTCLDHNNFQRLHEIKDEMEFMIKNKIKITKINTDERDNYIKDVMKEYNKKDTSHNPENEELKEDIEIEWADDEYDNSDEDDDRPF